MPGFGSVNTDDSLGYGGMYGAAIMQLGPGDTQIIPHLFDIPEGGYHYYGEGVFKHRVDWGNMNPDGIPPEGGTGPDWIPGRPTKPPWWKPSGPVLGGLSTAAIAIGAFLVFPGTAGGDDDDTWKPHFRPPNWFPGDPWPYDQMPGFVGPPNTPWLPYPPPPPPPPDTLPPDVPHRTTKPPTEDY
jgi:hypothetical protein